ncbi:hypothetical protein B0H11DRAFT_2199337 [Mycena galericulata]|nr:hypothetical protein B0H11DRAFT_2199337 [Mycena galericulata]
MSWGNVLRTPAQISDPKPTNQTKFAVSAEILTSFWSQFLCCHISPPKKAGTLRYDSNVKSPRPDNGLQPHFVMDQAKSNFRVNNVFPGHTLRKPQLGIPRGGAHPWNNIWAANGLHGSDGNLGSTSQTGNP